MLGRFIVFAWGKGKLLGVKWGGGVLIEQAHSTRKKSSMVLQSKHVRTTVRKTGNQVPAGAKETCISCARGQCYPFQTGLPIHEKHHTKDIKLFTTRR
jgi:hypothetical protein